VDIHVVVKVTKFCNLRCAYCYETPWLGDRERMQIEQVARLFKLINELIGLVGDKTSSVSFYWQGGEPLLLPVKFWNDLYNCQAELRASANVRIINEIQTNATRLTDAYVDMLRTRYSVGISYDVINDLRLTVGGRSTDTSVIAGIDRLRTGGVQISGGIAVISTANVNHPEEVARFYLNNGLNFRLLNIYTASDLLPNVSRVAVGWAEYIDFCRRVLDTPGIKEAMANGLSIEPFSSAFRMQARADAGDRVSSSEGQMEWVLIIDTNGDLYSAGDLYDPLFRYGNAFNDTIETLFLSDGRMKRIARARQRIERICASGCELFGRGCNGAYVGQCTREEELAFDIAGRCFFSEIAPLLSQVSCISA
jgi:uncharacterized protein